MAADQANLCGICGQEPGNGSGRYNNRLHVDHCHVSGKVRGLLCGNCNTMIGLSKENPATLLAAVEYLNRE